MVHSGQCCEFCNYEAESYSSQEYFCGCGQRFCSIDCLIDHGDEAHTNGDITSWPAGTDSRLFDSGEVERRWRERQAIAPEHSESGSDVESSDSSNDSDSDSDCSSDSDDEHDITCECGNYVGTVCNGHFSAERGAVASECDQDGVRWCSDCWTLDREYQEECDENENQEEEIRLILEECCADMCCCTATFTNNKGSFCSDDCLQRWSGCTHICSEENRNT